MKDISENIIRCSLCSHGQFLQARSYLLPKVWTIPYTNMVLLLASLILLFKWNRNWDILHHWGTLRARSNFCFSTHNYYIYTLSTRTNMQIYTSHIWILCTITMLLTVPVGNCCLELSISIHLSTHIIVILTMWCCFCKKTLIILFKLYVLSPGLPYFQPQPISTMTLRSDIQLPFSPCFPPVFLPCSKCFLLQMNFI